MTLRFLLARPWLWARLAQKAVQGGGAATLRFLLLHDVSSEERPAFEAAVAWLAQRNRLATPAEAQAILAGAPFTGDKVVLTFDDGFAGNLDLAETVLARHGAKAIFFVCPGLMDLEPTAQRAAIAANIFNGRRQPDALPPQCRLMTWAELERLASLGHEIANHTLSHRRLSTLGADEQEAEIAGGAEMLRQRLGSAGDWFAFPFGEVASVSTETIHSVARHHKFCRSGVRGGNDAKTHPLALWADHLDLMAPWAYQRLILEGGLDRLYQGPRDVLSRLTGERHGG